MFATSPMDGRAQPPPHLGWEAGRELWAHKESSVSWGRSPCPALLALLSGSLSPGRPLPVSMCQPRPGSCVLSPKCPMVPVPPSSVGGPLTGWSPFWMPPPPMDALAWGLAKGTVERSHVLTATPPSPSYHCKPVWHCPLSVPWGQVGIRWW